MPLYCRVPVRRGLQQTAWAATRHGARDNQARQLPRHKNLKKKKETNRKFDSPFLLRQGEPATSQHYYRPRSEGDNVLGSVRLSVCPSVGPHTAEDNKSPGVCQGVCLCVCNQWAYADNCADAVDRL